MTEAAEAKVAELREAADFALRFIRATFVEDETEDVYEGARRVKGEWIEDVVARLEAVTL